MTLLEAALLAVSRKSKYKKLMERLASAFAARDTDNTEDQERFWSISQIIDLLTQGYSREQIYGGIKEVLMGIRIQIAEGESA